MLKRLEYADIDFHGRIVCAVCGLNENISNIKCEMQKKEYWYLVQYTGKYLCQDCVKRIKG